MLQLAFLFALCLPTPVGGSVEVFQQAKVFQTGGQSNDLFGWSVDMDGNRAVVSSQETTFTKYGSVYLYDYTPSGWSLVQEIQANDQAPQDFFGHHVDLDGDRLVIGAHKEDNVMGVDAGAAYVYQRIGAQWQFRQKLVSPSVEPGDFFGRGVSVSGDRIVVGATAGGSFEGGAIHVWDLQGGIWTETAVLEPTQPFGQLAVFGHRSVIRGNRVFVGSPLVSKVYVFEETGSGWVESALLEGSGFMGVALAVSDDGKTLFAAANEDGDLGNQAGAVWVYEQQLDDSWSLVQKLFSSEAMALERFGYELSLSGNRLLVGTQVNAGTPTAQPNAYLFELQGGLWAETAKFTASGVLPNNNGYGQALAISGQRIVCCAPGDTGESFGTGAAYFHVLNATPKNYCSGKLNSLGCAPTIDWGGSPTIDGPDDFLVLTRNALPAKPGLFFWGGKGPAAIPFFGGTLCIQPPLMRTPVQISSGPPPCNGGYAFHFDQGLMTTAGLAPGDLAHGQFWMRDPDHPDGTGVVLTDGLEFSIQLDPVAVKR